MCRVSLPVTQHPPHPPPPPPPPKKKKKSSQQNLAILFSSEQKIIFAVYQTVRICLAYLSLLHSSLCMWSNFPSLFLSSPLVQLDSKVLKRFRSAAEHTDHASWFATRADKLHKLHSKAMWEEMVKAAWCVNHCEHSAFLPGSLVPWSFPDFIHLPRLRGFDFIHLPWLRDKIWEWPGSEASYQAPPSQLFGSTSCAWKLGGAWMRLRLWTP